MESVTGYVEAAVIDPPGQRWYNIKVSETQGHPQTLTWNTAGHAPLPSPVGFLPVRRAAPSLLKPWLCSRPLIFTPSWMTVTPIHLGSEKVILGIQVILVRKNEEYIISQRVQIQVTACEMSFWEMKGIIWRWLTRALQICPSEWLHILFSFLSLSATPALELNVTPEQVCSSVLLYHYSCGSGNAGQSPLLRSGYTERSGGSAKHEEVISL